MSYRPQTKPVQEAMARQITRKQEVMGNIIRVAPDYNNGHIILVFDDHRYAIYRIFHEYGDVEIRLDSDPPAFYELRQADLISEREAKAEEDIINKATRARNEQLDRERLAELLKKYGPPEQK